MKRVSEIITIEEINKWKDGDIITINAGTGVGKSHFIKNRLYDFAKKKNKKILLLVNRKRLKEQNILEINRDQKQDVIKVLTYQKLQQLKLYEDGFNFDEYEYIVADEFHYFLVDSIFSNTTDISLEMLLELHNKTRIFMSATSEFIMRYLTNCKKLTPIIYNVPKTYNNIKQLNFFNKDNTVINLLEELSERTNEKVIYFCKSARKAYDVSRQFKNSLFNCSTSNSLYRYVNEEKINTMLKEEKFNEQILISTTCLDNGVNIRDEQVKHIICEIDDIDILVQCLGRKRSVTDNDKIYVYIKNINNNRLGGKISTLKKKIVMADYLRENSIQDFLNKYPRQQYGNMIYDIIENNKMIKKVNELMYFKCITDIITYELMLISKDKRGYRNYIKTLLQMNEYFDLEEEGEMDNLEKYLESILGQSMLQVKDRKELINKIDVKSNGKQLKKINNLNGALEERNIPYRIVQFATSKMINGKQKRYPNAWRIEKLIY